MQTHNRFDPLYDHYDEGILGSPRTPPFLGRGGRAQGRGREGADPGEGDLLPCLIFSISRGGGNLPVGNHPTPHQGKQEETL